MRNQILRLLACTVIGTSFGCGGGGGGENSDVVRGSRQLDMTLAADLRRAGMTGNIESMLEARLSRKLDLKLAGLGRLLFFDTAGGLNDDNTRDAT